MTYASLCIKKVRSYLGVAYFSFPLEALSCIVIANRLSAKQIKRHFLFYLNDRFSSKIDRFMFSVHREKSKVYFFGQTVYLRC